MFHLPLCKLPYVFTNIIILAGKDNSIGGIKQNLLVILFLYVNLMFSQLAKNSYSTKFLTEDVGVHREKTVTWIYY